MNHRENALKLRVHQLEMQNGALKLTYDRMLSDIEMTESAGCAFAWELAQQEEAAYGDAFMHSHRIVESFNAALKAGEDFQEARKWLRDRIKADKEFRKTAIEAAGKNPEMEIETPFGRYSIRTLTAP